jgi:hypothetical protein
MVLSLSASFRDAATQGGQTPVVVADFDLDANPIGTYRIHNFGGILSGLSESNNAILSSVTNISRKVDPITRKTSSGTMTLEVIDDGTIRNWAGRKTLFNAKVYIKLGFDGVAIGDYLTVFVGVITEVLPGNGVIVIKLADEIFNLERRKFGGKFISKHPLEVAKQLIEYGAETTATTAADFDPTNYSTSISHFNMTSVSIKPYYEHLADMARSAEANGSDTTFSPVGLGRTGRYYGTTESIGHAPTADEKFVSVRPIIDEIAQFCGITFYVDETGSIRAKLYDSTTASARTLTADDYDELEQTNAFGGVVNQVIVGIENSQQSATYRRKDSTSLATFGEKTLKVTAGHLAPISFVGSATLFDPTTYTVELDGGMITGFSGVRGSIAVTASPTNGYLHTPATHAALSASRVATLAFAKLSATDAQIGECNSAVSINYHDAGVMERVAHFANTDDDGSAGGDSIKAVQNAKFNVTQVSGSTIATDEADDPDRADGMEIIDCTILKRFSDEVLTRFANGAITVEFRTSLRHADLQLGDFVDFETDKLLLSGADFDDDSISITAKFEIVEKEFDITSDVPSVKFTACQVSLSTAPAVSLADVVDIPDVALIPVRPTLTFMGGGIPSFTLPPTITSQSSSFEIEIGRGVMMRGDGSSMPVSTVEEIELPSDTITSIGYDSVTGAIVTTADGGIQSPRNAALSSIETDGSGVAGTIDIARLGSVGPKQLSETVTTGFDRLRNGGFEAWSHANAYPPDNWAMSSGTWNTDLERVSESLVLEGLYALRFPSSSTRASTAIVSDYIPIAEGEVYLITAAMKKTSGSPSGEVSVSFYNYAKSTVSNNVLQTKALTTSWLRIGGAIAAPTNARFARVFIARTGASTTTFVDDVKMEVGSPKFNAYQSANVTLSTAISEYVVIFDTEFVDIGSWYDNSTGIATAPVSGIYEIKTTIYFYSTGSATDFQVHLDKNGSSLYQFGRLDTQHYGAIDQPGVAHFDGPIALEAGDQIRIRVKDNLGAAFKAGNVIRGIGSIFSAQLDR